MSEKEFILALKKLNIELNENQILKFRVYCEFLIEYNQKTNLSAIKEEKEVYLKHFYDSAIIFKYIDFADKKVLDIGSGAGFPGVVLKIIDPSILLYCLDSNGKKTKFLELLSEKINIEYEVINDRAENYISDNREKFDFVVARAVKSMPVLAELCIPFVKIGGHFIAYKGQIDETIENGIFAIDELGGKVLKVYNEFLPIENSARSLVIVQKMCKTKDVYPRKYDKINKKPLQKR